MSYISYYQPLVHNNKMTVVTAKTKMASLLPLHVESEGLTGKTLETDRIRIRFKLASTPPVLVPDTGRDERKHGTDRT